MARPNPKEIEQKWQKKWADAKVFKTKLDDETREKWFQLMMFPYPSGAGLHIGHAFAFGANDVQARYQRGKGKNVFLPFGYDAFGIHGENYAMKIGRHPHDVAEENCANYTKQLDSLGIGWDKSREIRTYDEKYYKWTQWIFLEMQRAGLVERKIGEVNFCPECKTVISDEQAQGGVCERHDCTVEKRKMTQWYLRITKYAEKLHQNLEWIDWEPKVKIAQRNWIGRKEGCEVDFTTESGETIRVFTTRVDTLAGVTFLALAPENKLVNLLTTAEQKNEVEKYVTEIKNEISSGSAREIYPKVREFCDSGTPSGKTGVFTGSFAKNPLTGEKVKIFVADYVLSGFGTGAVMGVPAHDKRDYDFAAKFMKEDFNGVIKCVVSPISFKIINASNIHEGFAHDISVSDEDWQKKEFELVKNGKRCFIDDGILVNSGEFNGLDSATAREKIAEFLKKEKIGNKKISYRLRDWCISRQRYWGPPVPMVHCEKCGIVVEKDENLPIRLPEMRENWEPTGDGRGPLATQTEWMKCKCPNCDGDATRDTDVMDNFLDSSWYFLRYPCIGDDERAFDSVKTQGEK